MSLRGFAAALFVGMLAPAASALPPSPPLPWPDAVVEYFNTGTGHYFYTWNPADHQALASGAFGAGWVKTGLAFAAWGTRDRARYPGSFGWAPFDSCAAPGACVEIARFHAPGPNSRFFTGDAGEIAMLDRPGSGWVRENVAFYTAMPDASGHCRPGTVAVYRLYNNRAALNDTNHRFTASEASRRLTIARGWIDEGIAFCAYGKRDAPGPMYEFQVASREQVMGLRECRDARIAGSCVGLMNLPIPSHGFASSSAEARPDEFDRETGMYPPRRPASWAVDGSSRAGAAAGTFVQIAEDLRQPGIHLVSRDRSGGGPYASIAAVRRVAAGELRPYDTQHATEHVLVLQAAIGVQEAAAAPGSHAYGVLSAQFTDETSGRSLLFHVLAYGNISAGEGVATDVHTSLPIVYTTTLDGNGRFGGHTGTLHGATAQQVQPRNTVVRAQIGRPHFQAILDAARTVDPALSPRPDDYSVANLALVNETYGEGEIGVVVWDMDILTQLAP